MSEVAPVGAPPVSHLWSLGLLPGGPGAVNPGDVLLRLFQAAQRSSQPSPGASEWLQKRGPSVRPSPLSVAASASF